MEKKTILLCIQDRNNTFSLKNSISSLLLFEFLVEGTNSRDLEDLHKFVCSRVESDEREAGNFEPEHLLHAPF